MKSNNLLTINHLLNEPSGCKLDGAQLIVLEEEREINSQLMLLMAHDLRGPIANISGFLSLLKLNIPDDISAINKEYIDLASKSSMRAINLLHELTLWSITQNQGKSFRPIELNLLSVLQDEIDALKYLCKAKGIKLGCFIDPSISVKADSHMLKAIVRNIAANAVKFTPENGEIDINVNENNNYTTILIKDNGKGIAKNEIKKIFRGPINIINKPLNRDGGMKMGLKICSYFIGIHKGQIKCTSELGIGSEFYCRFPK